MHRSVVVVLLLASLAVGACGGSSKSNSSGAPPVGVSQVNVPTQPTPPENFTQKQRFQISEQICQAQKPHGMRLEYGLPGKTDQEIASSWSYKTIAKYRKMAYDGCLAGFAAAAKK
jgi:hypothetical protein